MLGDRKNRRALFYLWLKLLVTIDEALPGLKTKNAERV